MRIAIHQPNLVPWYPFFQKMAAVDVFVVLTRCQFSREHYQHRFKHKDRWYTLGVRDIKHPEPINQKVYANPVEDWAAIKRRLPQHAQWLGQFDGMVQPSLWRTNFSILLAMRDLLGIKTEVIVDPIPSCTGTDRLVEICLSFKQPQIPVTYLAGLSGGHYMDLDKFRAADIAVEFQQVTDTRHVFEL